MHANPDLLALLALGERAGSPDEHAHLTECPECRAELHSLRVAAEIGRRTTEEDVLASPPPHVWHRISAELQLKGAGSRGGATPPPPAGSGGPVPAAVPNRRSVRAAAFVLAAALALVVGIGIGANLNRVGPADTQVSAVQLNALPPYPGSAGRATIEKDRDGKRTLVVQITSPERATGPREVWLTNTVADPMVAMGILADDYGRFPIPDDMRLTEFPLVDISQEPVGDKDPHHSGHSMLRGKFPV